MTTADLTADQPVSHAKVAWARHRGLFILACLPLAAATVLSAQYLYELGKIGFTGSWTPYLVPAAVDGLGAAGTVAWATRSAPEKARRFGSQTAVAAALISVAGNIVSHLVNNTIAVQVGTHVVQKPAPYLEVGIWLVIAIAVIPVASALAGLHLMVLAVAPIPAKAKRARRRPEATPPAEASQPEATPTAEPGQARHRQGARPAAAKGTGQATPARTGQEDRPGQAARGPGQASEARPGQADVPAGMPDGNPNDDPEAWLSWLRQLHAEGQDISGPKLIAWCRDTGRQVGTKTAKQLVANVKKPAPLAVVRS
jgi:hypothetical protein